MIDKNEVISINKEELTKYLKMAADTGDVDSMFDNASTRESGRKISMDKEEKAKYYQMPADRGYVHGMSNYADMLNNCK